MTTANGYDYQFTVIKRATLQPFDLNDDLPAVNYFSNGTSIEQRQHSYQRRDLSVALEMYIRNIDDPFTDIASLLAENVETALHRTANNPQPGDDNESLLFSGATPVGELFIDGVDYSIGEGQKPYCGAVMAARIRYQILTGLPSTLQAI